MTAMLILQGAVLFGASAFAFPGAKETFKPHIPFNAMSPLPTHAAKLASAFLGRRQDQQQPDETPVLVAPDNTCGYIDGNSRGAFTCDGADATCVLLFSTGFDSGVVGCCGSTDCGFRTDCVASTQSCGSSCRANTRLLKCTESANPFCNSVAFLGGVVDYFCFSTELGSTLNADTTFNGQTGRTFQTFDLAETSTSNTDSDDSPATSSTVSTRSSEGIIPPISTKILASTSATPSSQDDNDDKSNVGAIAGGVVGGIAVLALFVLGLWFMRKKKSRKNNSPPDQTAQQYQPPPAGMYQALPPNPSHGHDSQYPEKNSAYFTATSVMPTPDVTPSAGLGLSNTQFSPYGSPHPESLPQQVGVPPPPENYQQQQLPYPPSARMTQAGGSGDFTYQNFGGSPDQAYAVQQQQQPMAGSGAYSSPFVPPAGGQVVPVEAGGTAIGGNVRSDHHKGNIHELA